MPGSWQSRSPGPRWDGAIEASLDIIRDPTREVYVARDETGLAGFLILCMTGAFIGYIQTVCIDPSRRGHGLGTRLVEFAEQRILPEARPTFSCVSPRSTKAPGGCMNGSGYKVIGELTDYIVQGHSEFLLRKTLGPLTGFAAQAPAKVAHQVGGRE